MSPAVRSHGVSKTKSADKVNAVDGAHVAQQVGAIDRNRLGRLR